MVYINQEEANEINYITTNESITLFWEKPERLPEKFIYRIFCEGKQIGETEKTHYTLHGLSAETEYQIEVRLYEQDDCLSSDEIVVKTACTKTLIDITKAPYFAVGDGKTMNTEAIQQAIDDCKETEAVYIPAGVFMTGALRLHSDMELYLEKDAVLQGTDRLEDYLPKIKSRFEGTEMECYSSLLNLG
ncbi:MAG: glycoside hydrolase family 28 protein, partial [Lachnospiraceae bacterium]|nr:glycoside hydrolase family 28 protein [Lachnospiraceae bacterium]